MLRLLRGGQGAEVEGGADHALELVLRAVGAARASAKLPSLIAPCESRVLGVLVWLKNRAEAHNVLAG